MATHDAASVHKYAMPAFKRGPVTGTSTQTHVANVPVPTVAATSEQAQMIGVVRLLRFVGRWEDESVDPSVELVVGCVLLIASWSWFWQGTGAITDGWRNVVGAISVVLGPWLIYRGWNRRRTTYVPWPPRTDEARLTQWEAELEASREKSVPFPFRSVTCVTCREDAELVGMPDKKLGFLGYAVLCPRCGVYGLERVDQQ